MTGLLGLFGRGKQRLSKESVREQNESHRREISDALAGFRSEKTLLRIVTAPDYSSDFPYAQSPIMWENAFRSGLEEIAAKARQYGFDLRKDFQGELKAAVCEQVFSELNTAYCNLYLLPSVPSVKSHGYSATKDEVREGLRNRFKIVRRVAGEYDLLPDVMAEIRERNLGYNHLRESQKRAHSRDFLLMPVHELVHAIGNKK